ncbi:type II secretion system protein GspG [Thiospirochaeta perfilievii]|uniref:Type II secretion system protein GspG n=1 Tax=Thiospirochaeta perfilievii TaxID=252967 RepID=A0A5C1QBZ7_9SPIO|nr:type II secretion system major pseudopilin GspG [Thiospirochaeta perfilievii]QEN05061.1 type II secretion system protein GspG [Thiospirochaeta perfilievii]
MIKKLIKILKEDDGWTFIETIIGIAIVLLLTTGVGVVAVKQMEKANVTAATSQIGNFKLALEMYRQDNKVYPTVEQGLNSLWEKPVLSPVPKNWDGPYIDKKTPLDPWDNEYLYKIPGENGLPFTISSLGADSTIGGLGLNKDINSYD